MNDATTRTDALLPCPFCGESLHVSKHRLASCTTSGCYMHNFVVDVDNPKSVRMWNTRAPARGIAQQEGAKG